jgi:ubiquitin-conjugating enzyme E2 Z
MNNTIISKDSIQRLLKDVKDIIKHPLTSNGIYYKHDDEDMLKGYALIIGPEDTPYFGGYYFFEFIYPYDYPYSPPKVKFCTNGSDVRFNPNLYKCGKVCVSILNTWTGDQWTSTQTISTVLLTLCTLFCENPLLNEPGINKLHPDMNNYNTIIEYANLNIAVTDIILLGNKNTDIVKSLSNNFTFLHFFHHFHSTVNENIKKNIEKLLEFVQKKVEEYPDPILCKTALYSMSICIDYKKLFQKLSNCKEYIVKENIL